MENRSENESSGDEALQEFAALLVRFVRVNLLGWFSIFRRVALWVFRKFMALALVEILFLTLCLLSVAFALLPWIEYDVQFRTLETVRVGSRCKILFVVPGMLGLLFRLRTFSTRTTIYYFLVAPVAVLYGLGYAFPNPVHHAFLKDTLWLYAPWIYAYGFCLLALVALAERALAHRSS